MPCRALTLPSSRWRAPDQLDSPRASHPWSVKEVRFPRRVSSAKATYARVEARLWMPSFGTANWKLRLRACGA